MKLKLLAAGLVLLVTACAQKPAPDPAGQGAEPTARPETTHVTGPSDIAAGAYLAEIGGCHDCHTPGWAQTGGQVPEDQWLIGSPVGFSGPWGTSYPGNLRLSVDGTDAGAWADMMKDRNGLPPMPWTTVNHMSREDLLAIHAYITSLGPAGEPVPMAVTDGSAPSTPYIWFAPVGRRIIRSPSEFSRKFSRPCIQSGGAVHLTSKDRDIPVARHRKDKLT